jgi:hypothetical protein
MAYLSLDTGEIFWISDFGDDEQEIPEDLETSDRYIEVPQKKMTWTWEIDLLMNLSH